MIDSKKTVLASTMAFALVACGTQTALAAGVVGQDAPDTQANAAESASSHATAQPQVLPGVMGEFSYDQTTITPNETIRTLFQKATAALCAQTESFTAVNPLAWRLSVTGEVTNAFSADVGELASEESVKSVMTCTCGGNPVDGAAIITADVKGIPISALLDKAEAHAGANALTFVSSDGTEVTLPLTYVVGRHGVLSYEINGEDLSASVGGNNQLWMTRTPANYFVRDVVEIRVSKEAVAPANPGEDMEYPNSPNVGIMASQIS